MYVCMYVIDVRIVIYRTWPIGCGFEVFSRVLNFIVIGSVPNLPSGIKSKCSRFSEFHSNKKSDCMNFKSTVQIPKSSHFQILCRGDHFRSGIIYGTIWGSFPVLRSFAVQFGDHLRGCTDSCLAKIETPRQLRKKNRDCETHITAKKRDC